MKYFSIFLLFFSSPIFSQSNYDGTWVLTKDGENASILDFTMDSLEVFAIADSFPIQLKGTNATMCDSLGNLLFYSNGVDIVSHNHKIMENGETLNPGEVTDNHENGHNKPGAAIALPHPDSDSLYYLFHLGFVFSVEFGVIADKYLYSLIDMSANNGLGKVIEKDQILIENSTMVLTGVTTVRHANGRDWWIIVPKQNSNEYHKLLLSPEGIEEQPMQAIGETVIGGLGQSVFSPDGTKYVRNNIISGLTGQLDAFEVYDFDRCSGLLSNHQKFIYADTSWAGGVAISPNSRFVYISTQDYVFQYDLEASDIEASIDTVAIYDGFESPFTTHFFMAQLAPDNKIYLNSPNSVNVLHVIHNPDEKGAACNFEQHGISLPHNNLYSLPSNPYFKLGALEGSPCDTIGLINTSTEVVEKGVYKVYPNPTNDVLTLTVDEDNLEMVKSVVIVNLHGQIVQTINLATDTFNHSLSTKTLANGVYYLKVLDEQERSLFTEKLIVIH